ncbi:MAG: UvrD-helicase domain-containing protein [Vicinamibacterales bacterium]
MKQPSLFDADPSDARDDAPAPPDQAARVFAVDPLNDVVLEASAGTGKTRVLVDRYVRLLEAGVDPRHVLAITFTRKAAAEMRERVLAELRRRAAQRLLDPERWRVLRERIADIQISTIDAFCFGLLREFPLEADVDPAFQIADETEMARFASEALDLTLRAARARLQADETLRLLFTRVKAPVLRPALLTLLDRRHVALPAVGAYVKRTLRHASADEVAAAFRARLAAHLAAFPDRAALLDDGPAGTPEFDRLAADLRAVVAAAAGGPRGPDADVGAPAVPPLRRRLERYFLTTAGTPRKRLASAYKTGLFASKTVRARHEAAMSAFAPGVLAALEALDADIDALLARGLLVVLAMANERYERLLEEHALLDFAGMLAKAVSLLGRQEEFARSRLKLQARYHHVLVDEFQDTSRLQWRLVELLVDAWGEGAGVADAPTSIFVVGDRKQSIYRFRHAEVTLLDAAAEKIAALRGGRDVRRAISASFRAVPELLAFVNALASTLEGPAHLDDRFRYADTDRFPVPPVERGGLRDGRPVVGIVAAPTMADCAGIVAAEIERLLAGTQVRDRHGPPRPAQPDDVAILFRVRAGHQYFEEALEARGIRTYVYKGLGFFDAPEVQDLQALLRYLARPESDLRAAELLRSRIFRVSDPGLVAIAPGFAAALAAPATAPIPDAMGPLDRAVLARARDAVARWRQAAGRMPPSELVDRVIAESAYAAELAGRRLDQARENVKKVRALIRRVESRGYATLGRLAEYFETLRAGEESNAIVAASGAVNLMTIHAAKGLEFPIVFVVNLHVPGRGRGGGVEVIDNGPGREPEVAFGSSEATRLEEQRDTEEQKRLLYVAATRARDRLYFASELDARGQLRRAARAFSGLLPAGLAEAFAAAGRGETAARWPTPEGDFELELCQPSPAAGPGVADRAGEEVPVQIDVVAVAPADVVPVSALVQPAADVERGAPGARASSGEPGAERLVGTLVHRLFQQEPPVDLDEAALARRARALARETDLVDVADPDAAAWAAARVFGRLRHHAGLRAALASGERFYEVPFSTGDPACPGRVVRGIIDCLVARPDGGYTVVEVKTGAAREWHARQAEIYARAVSEAAGGAEVSVQIVYP